MKNPRPGQPLSEREIEVLWLIAEGLSNKLIADRLGFSEHTAKFHVVNAITKMGCSTRTKAAVDFVLFNRIGEAVDRLQPSLTPKVGHGQAA